MSRTTTGVAVVLALAASTLARTASAQLEEIVVTARKLSRPEAAQDTPLAVTAFSAAQLEDAFVRNIEDLSFAVPNVSLDSVGVSPGVQNFAIRGFGLNSSIPSVDPTVGLFVDGVYLGVTYGAVLDMFDLESIEVLRGPQGLLFGRNVTGGAVLVRTRRPSREPGVRIKASIGSGLEYLLAGSVEGPLGTVAAGKLAAYLRDDSGYFKSVATPGSNYGEDRTYLVRPSLLYTPTEALELLVRYEHGKTHGDGGIVQNMAVFDEFDTGVGTEGSTDIRWDQVMVEANWKVPFGDGTITNIFGWRDLEHVGLTDVDGLAQVNFHGAMKVLQDQYSNELRYSGTFADDIELTAGGYYFTQDIVYREERILAGGALRSTLGGDQRHRTAAAFVAADVGVGPVITVNLGMRYTHEYKRAGIATFNLMNSPCDFRTTVCAFDFRDSHNWDNWVPKLGFTWAIRDEALAYFFWTKGVRSGGYNFRNTNPLVAPGPTDAEKQDSFELGMKSEWANRRARLNAALFYNDIDGLQREIILADPVAGLAQVIRNSADARIRGFEVEGALVPVPGLTLTAAVGHTDADYTKVHFDLNADGVINAADEVLRLPRVSPWTFNAGATWDHAIGSLGSLMWKLQFSHRDRAPFSDANTTFLSKVDLLDASVTYRHPYHEQLSVAFYAKNLTDHDYEGAVTPLPWGPIRYLNKGRRFGLEMNVGF